MPKFLTVAPKEGESAEEFAKRVSEQVSSHFGTENTPEPEPETEVPVEPTAEDSDVEETAPAEE